MKIQIQYLDEKEKVFKQIMIDDITDQLIWIGDGIHDLEIFDNEEQEIDTLMLDL